MAETQNSLADLFLGGVGADSALAFVETNILPELSAVPTGLNGLGWSDFSGEIVEAFRASLNVSFADVLTGAWTKMQELQEYLDPERHPPEEVALVPLVRHSVRSKHHPAVEILYGEEVLFTFTFDVDLSLDVEGAILKVQAGQIFEIVSASVGCSGKLKYGSAELLSGRTKRYSISTPIRLKSRIPIPRLPDTSSTGIDTLTGD
jgi:hypothetical protein